MLENSIKEIVKAALKEDAALRDITSDLTIKEDLEVKFAITARQDLIFCGQEIILEVFQQLRKAKKFKNTNLDLDFKANDGDSIKSKKPILTGFGNAKLIFAGERVILNLIQHLSAISTKTAQIIKHLNNKKIAILDTRKTLPNLRALQKYAHKIGGGVNHRFNLSDAILIKDNHIAACASIEKAILNAKKSKKKIEIECDNFTQVKKAIALKPDIIMLDNMSANEIKKCSNLIRATKAKILIEVSGGISLENISNYSNLDIDFISIGAITHSVIASDIGLDIL
jgi:nicotinate-nucleotide pyrophosphorylase (carboxylating)